MARISAQRAGLASLTPPPTRPHEAKPLPCLSRDQGSSRGARVRASVHSCSPHACHGKTWCGSAPEIMRASCGAMGASRVLPGAPVPPPSWRSRLASGAGSGWIGKAPRARCSWIFRRIVASSLVRPPRAQMARCRARRLNDAVGRAAPRIHEQEMDGQPIHLHVHVAGQGFNPPGLRRRRRAAGRAAGALDGRKGDRAFNALGGELGDQIGNDLVSLIVGHGRVSVS
jgi:hypothetical protein